MNDEYSGIRHQPIDANNCGLKPALISMVQQQQFGGSPLEVPMGTYRTSYNCVTLYR